MSSVLGMLGVCCTWLSRKWCPGCKYADLNRAILDFFNHILRNLYRFLGYKAGIKGPKNRKKRTTVISISIFSTPSENHLKPFRTKTFKMMGNMPLDVVIS